MLPDLDKIADQYPAPSSKCTRSDFVKLAAMCLVGATLFLLFYLGSKPVAVGLIPAPWDKLAHGALFAFMAFVGGYSATILELQKRWILTFTFVVAVFLGAMDEYHQLSLPGRQFDLADLASDALGALAGVMALSFSGLVKPPKRPQFLD